MPIKVEGFGGGDRTAIELPRAQAELVNALASTGKPLVVVLMSGSAVALGDAATKPQAILEAWYPGQAGGEAIADTLFGQSNPSGRLPVTFYAATSQLPPFADYAMRDRTYRYFSGKPLYPFGFGLSYAHFTYSKPALVHTQLTADTPLEVSVDVTNASGPTGDEVVQCYLVPKNEPGTPLRKLVGFEKVRLAAGQTRTVPLQFDARTLSLVDAEGHRRVEPGDYTLYLGGSQPGDGAGLSLPLHIDQTIEMAP
jgi:beta-glucosidase